MQPRTVISLVAAALASIVLIKVVMGDMLTAQGQLERGATLLEQGDAAGALEMYNAASNRFEPGSADWCEAALGRVLALTAIDSPRATAEFLALAERSPEHLDEQTYLEVARDLRHHEAPYAAWKVLTEAAPRFPGHPDLQAALDEVVADLEALDAASPEAAAPAGTDG